MIRLLTYAKDYLTRSIDKIYMCANAFSLTMRIDSIRKTRSKSDLLFSEK